MKDIVIHERRISRAEGVSRDSRSNQDHLGPGTGFAPPEKTYCQQYIFASLRDHQHGVSCCVAGHVSLAVGTAS